MSNDLPVFEKRILYFFLGWLFPIYAGFVGGMIIGAIVYLFFDLFFDFSVLFFWALVFIFGAIISIKVKAEMK